MATLIAWGTLMFVMAHLAEIVKLAKTHKPKGVGALGSNFTSHLSNSNARMRKWRPNTLFPKWMINRWKSCATPSSKVRWRLGVVSKLTWWMGYNSADKSFLSVRRPWSAHIRVHRNSRYGYGVRDVSLPHLKRPGVLMIYSMHELLYATKSQIPLQELKLSSGMGLL